MYSELDQKLHLEKFKVRVYMQILMSFLLHHPCHHYLIVEFWFPGSFPWRQPPPVNCPPRASEPMEGVHNVRLISPRLRPSSDVHLSFSSVEMLSHGFVKIKWLLPQLLRVLLWRRFLLGFILTYGTTCSSASWSSALSCCSSLLLKMISGKKNSPNHRHH